MPSIASMKMLMWIVVICASCITPFRCRRMPRTTGDRLPNHHEMSCDDMHRMCSSMTSKCPLDLICLSTDVFKGETAIIICSVKNDSFNVIDISKGPPDESKEIATIIQDGTVSQQSTLPLGKYEITYTQSPSMLTVKIQNFVCGDQNQYRFSWDGGSSSPSVTTSSITMKAKPEIPTLTISPDLIENENEMMHTCRANVGNPAGYLQLEIRHPSSNNFTIYSSSVTNLQVETKTCSTIHTLSFAIDLSENVNGSLFRCVSKNDKTTNKRDEIKSSIEYKIVVIPRNLCSGFGDSTFRVFPGKDCYKFVECVHGKPHVRTCGLLCPNAIIGMCDHCHNVPHCQ